MMSVVKWLLVSVCFLLTLTGLLEFKLWSQVTFIWEERIDFNELLLDPHGMRYLLVFPIFSASEFFNVSYDWLFSNIIIVLILVSVAFIIRSVKTLNYGLSRNDEKSLFLILLISFMLLSLFMNGRIIFALTGSSLLVYIFLVWDRRSFAGVTFPVLLSVFLCSVSSGTFYVAVISLVVFLVYKCLKTGVRFDKNYMLMFAVAGVISLAFPLFELLLMKNVDYFGGGWNGLVNMLAHGYGVIFLNVDMYVIGEIISILVSGALLFMLWVPYFKNFLVPVYMIGISLSGGMFGYSTMMMFIPPTMVILCLIILGTYKYTNKPKVDYT